MDLNVKDEVAALNLGKKIRGLRTQQGLTLQVISDRTGLSKPQLSQIENNIAAPPIATLIKISKALGVKISHFFQDQTSEERIVVVRKDERHGLKKLSHHDHDYSEIGYRYESLAYPMDDKHMEPFIVEFAPHEESKHFYNNHKGEEFLFILEGRLEFKGGTTSQILEAGDSIYFDSSISHALRAIDVPAKALVIVFTPK
ncbi:MAG: helix-turn-helix transcriptional regulator [Desulfobacterium sp.]|nr:helix-turn-helix transcriptional regulator [Desulfobacterium sp.]